MVVCTLHIIALKPGVSVASFLSKLREGNAKPLFQAKALRWMILPSKQSAGHLLGRNKHWDLLIGLEAGVPLPPHAVADMDDVWTASCGVSSQALSGYAQLNAKLFDAATSPMPFPSGHGTASSQNLELSSELREWCAALPAELQDRPISMLNLLAFAPGKKDQYKKYGVEFSSRVGANYGGRPKLIGRVIEGGEGRAHEDGWDEVAFVHYPSLNHFASMLASTPYQEVNQQYRLGALKDTFILCVVEVDDRGELVAKQLKHKL